LQAGGGLGKERTSLALNETIFRAILSGLVQSHFHASCFFETVVKSGTRVAFLLSVSVSSLIHAVFNSFPFLPKQTPVKIIMESSFSKRYNNMHIVGIIRE